MKVNYDIRYRHVTQTDQIGISKLLHT